MSSSLSKNIGPFEPGSCEIQQKKFKKRSYWAIFAGHCMNLRLFSRKWHCFHEEVRVLYRLLLIWIVLYWLAFELYLGDWFGSFEILLLYQGFWLAL